MLYAVYVAFVAMTGIIERMKSISMQMISLFFYCEVPIMYFIHWLWVTGNVWNDGCVSAKQSS